MTAGEEALGAAVRAGGLPRTHTRRIVEAYERARREGVPGELAERVARAIRYELEKSSVRGCKIENAALAAVAAMTPAAELAEDEAVELMACAYDAYEVHRPSNYFALRDAYRALAAVAEVRRRA